MPDKVKSRSRSYSPIATKKRSRSRSYSPINKNRKADKAVEKISSESDKKDKMTKGDDQNIVNKKLDGREKVNTCWRWEKGQCQRGSACFYKHETPSSSENEQRITDNGSKSATACWGFKNGYCKHGDSCRFVHGSINAQTSLPGLSKRVFVGNLDFKVTSNDLARFMAEGGCITFAEVFPGGRGVVEYTSLAEAAWAIRTLHDRLFWTRRVVVKPERSDVSTKKSSTHSKPISSKNDDNGDGGAVCRVYVGNLDYTTTDEELRGHFVSCGEVKTCFVICDHTGKSKGCGLVEFSTSKAARRAIDDCQDTLLKGRKMFVREDREKTVKTPIRKMSSHKDTDTKQVDKPKEEDNAVDTEVIEQGEDDDEGEEEDEEGEEYEGEDSLLADLI